jgi:DNA-binding GntR family transcriptional regulator
MAQESDAMLLNQIDSDNHMAISRSTLADRAVELLRELILLEKLKPNEVLAERELSEKLGVSRTPLREALRVLASEGLVEMSPNLRPKVANPTLEQLMDLIDVLSSLERLAGELLCESINDDLIAQLDELVAKMKHFPDDGEELEFFNIDMKFHRTIVAATQNQQLIITHTQYNAAVFRARFMSTKWTSRRPLMHVQHAEIVDLLKKRDADAAGSMLKAHLQQLKINVTELFAAKQKA